MIDKDVTWIVVADGAHMRVFEERQRAGAVRELPTLALRLDEQDHPHATAHAATVHDRHGHGRHADKDIAPAQVAEARFLARAAGVLEGAARNKAFDRLVLMATPHALGVLRRELSPTLLAKVEVTDARNRLQDDADAVRLHLRQARARG